LDYCNNSNSNSNSFKVKSSFTKFNEVEQTNNANNTNNTNKTNKVNNYNKSNHPSSKESKFKNFLENDVYNDHLQQEYYLKYLQKSIVEELHIKNKNNINSDKISMQNNKLYNNFNNSNGNKVNPCSNCCLIM